MYQRKRLSIFVRALVLGITLLLFSACSHTTPAPTSASTSAKQKSFTKLPKGKAPLLSYLNNTDQKLGDYSAFHSLSEPRDAFAARIFLVDQAKTSLDVQYYIYKDDRTGNFFAYHLLKAAERGVKVRILLDDLITSGKDKSWAMLASHPNIELRLFNPNLLRSSFRNMALLFNINRLGKRMHNKTLIADGAAAIIGGRNIGDDYYAADKETLFLDYDILATGKVVPDIYRSFDLYWNSKESVLSKEVLEGQFNTAEYHQAVKKLEKSAEVFRQSSIGKAMARSDFAKNIFQGKVELTVAKRTDFYYDYPEKVNTDESDNRTHISAQISADLKHVSNDLIIISPYFIPSQEMMERLRVLRENDVEITVITNSLASTDVFAVYSKYRWYIKDLVQIGVNLYELKPKSFKKLIKSKKWIKSHQTSLHTKMMIIDQDHLVVGSANIDPRSDKLNTELLLVVSSRKLAKEERTILMEILGDENFYRVTWGKHPAYPGDDDVPTYGPVWHSIKNGKEKVYYTPPHSGYFRTLGTDILSFLPIEGYL
ncbi:MAG: phospholipase D family protein [Campylobacterota bacterium]|nr:phospholipase D family protein [Campylobacterota bacterium]